MKHVYITLLSVLLSLRLYAQHNACQTLTPVNLNNLPTEKFQTHDHWMWLNPVPHGGFFHCVEMVSADTVLAGGYYGYGVIYYTYDAGRSWNIACLPEDITGTVKKIRMFANGKDGYALIEKTLLETLEKTLLETHDAGKTWQKTSDFPAFAMAPLAKDLGLLPYGTKKTHGGNIIQIVSSTPPEPHSVSFDLGHNFHIMKNKLVSGQRIVTQSNGQNVNFDELTTGIFFFLDSLNIWSLIANDYNEGAERVKLYYSSDKGQSWIQKGNVPVCSISQLSYRTECQPVIQLLFKNSTEGYIIRGNSSVLDGTALFRTQNGGASWAQLNNAPQNISSLAFADNQTGYVVSRDVLTEEFTLYRTTDNAGQWTAIESSLHPDRLNYQLLGDTLIVKKGDSIKVSVDKGISYIDTYRLNSKPVAMNPEQYMLSADNLHFSTTRFCIYRSPNQQANYYSLNGGRTFFRMSGGNIELVNPYGYISGDYLYQLQPVQLTPGTHNVVDISHGADRLSEHSTLQWIPDKQQIVIGLQDKEFSYATDHNIPSITLIRSAKDNLWERVGVMAYWLDFPLIANYNNYLNLKTAVSFVNFSKSAKIVDKNFALFTDNSFSKSHTGGFLNMSGSFPETIHGIKSLPDAAGTGAILYGVGNSIYRITSHDLSVENLGSPGAMLRAVDFTDTQNGFIGGNNCELYKTINSGNFWTRAFRPRSQVSELSGAFFISSMEGFAISPSTLYTTIDGGSTWQIVVNHGFGDNEKLFVTPSKSHAFIQSKSGTLFRVTLATKQVEAVASGVKDFHFFGTSGFYISNTELYSTTNHGAEWQKTYTFSGVTLNALGFSDPVNGYVGGNSGKLFRTYNGGLSWTDISVAGVKINGISAVSADTAFVGGDNGTFFFSYDGGEVWEPRTTGTQDNLHHLHFFDGNRGYLVTSLGYISTDNAGSSFSLYRPPVRDSRTELGDSLRYFKVGYERKSSSLFIINNSFSEFIYVDGINVLRNGNFTPEDITTSIDFTTGTETNGSITIYPNPAGSVIHIESEYPFSNLSVLDLAGNQLFSTPTGKTTIYKQDVSWLQPGVYLLRINSRNIHQYRKFVIQ